VSAQFKTVGAARDQILRLNGIKRATSAQYAAIHAATPSLAAANALIERGGKINLPTPTAAGVKPAQSQAYAIRVAEAIAKAQIARENRSRSTPRANATPATLSRAQVRALTPKQRTAYMVRGERPAPPVTMARAAFRNLTPAARAAFARQGGTLSD
jgi:hypothetical protein